VRIESRLVRPLFQKIEIGRVGQVLYQLIAQAAELLARFLNPVHGGGFERVDCVVPRAEPRNASDDG